MKSKYMIIHHSLTKDSKTVSWSAIRRYHTETLGWKDIGYHYGIELINDYYEILSGRPENERGAHCIGRNYDSLGICFVGNYDLSPPSNKMLDRAISFLVPIINRNNIRFDRILPHSDFANKTCPGKLFPMEGFVEALKRGKL